MNNLLSKRLALAVTVVFLTILCGASAQSAEKKKISGSGGKGLREISKSVVYPGDVPKHELIQITSIETITSTETNFNDIEVQQYYQNDLVAGSGTSSGYRILLHKNGDESYNKFKGTQKLIIKEGGEWEVAFEGTWRFTGGTGKFINIKGGGTYQGKVTKKGYAYDWEGEAEY